MTNTNTEETKVSPEVAEAVRKTWLKVFDIVSDHCYNGTRALIYELERAREEAVPSEPYKQSHEGCISKSLLKDRVEHYRRFLDDIQGMSAERREYYLKRIEIFTELVEKW